MANHLIKRRELDNKFEDGWRCETSLGKWPAGSKVKKDDNIYMAQNGYAIYGKGVVDKIIKNEFLTISDFLYYIFHESNIKDDNYWIMKLKQYSEKKSTPKIKVLEFKLKNTESFDFKIPLEKRFLTQQTWFYLEDDFKLKVPSIDVNLTTHIPSKIRAQVYHNFKILSNEHIIDIDHFVPKDIGGPGNIIENLIPISASINRTKSNKVPSKLLDLANDFGIKRPKKLIVSHDKFYSQATEEFKLASKIVEKINNQSIIKLRETYKIIRDFHFPYLKD